MHTTTAAVFLILCATWHSHAATITSSCTSNNQTGPEITNTYNSTGFTINEFSVNLTITTTIKNATDATQIDDDSSTSYSANFTDIIILENKKEQENSSNVEDTSTANITTSFYSTLIRDAEYIAKPMEELAIILTNSINSTNTTIKHEERDIINATVITNFNVTTISDDNVEYLVANYYNATNTTSILEAISARNLTNTSDFSVLDILDHMISHNSTRILINFDQSNNSISNTSDSSVFNHTLFSWNIKDAVHRTNNTNVFTSNQLGSTNSTATLDNIHINCSVINKTIIRVETGSFDSENSIPNISNSTNVSDCATSNTSSDTEIESSSNNFTSSNDNITSNTTISVNSTIIIDVSNSTTIQNNETIYSTDTNAFTNTTVVIEDINFTTNTNNTNITSTTVSINSDNNDTTIILITTNITIIVTNDVTNITAVIYVSNISTSTNLTQDIKTINITNVKTTTTVTNVTIVTTTIADNETTVTMTYINTTDIIIETTFNDTININSTSVDITNDTNSTVTTIITDTSNVTVTTISTNTSTSLTTPIDNSTNSTSICTSNGYIADPNSTNCTAYIQCVENDDGSFTETTYTCPDDSLYNPNTTYCDFDYECPTDEEEEKEEEDEFTCTSAGRFANTADSTCQTYYYCVLLSNGVYVEYEYTCPSTSVFDPTNKICTTSYTCDS